MSTESAKNHSLYAVPITAQESSLQERQDRNARQLAVCSSCSGTGWEFIVDKGVCPCHCRTVARIHCGAQGVLSTSERAGRAGNFSKRRSQVRREGKRPS